MMLIFIRKQIIGKKKKLYFSLKKIKVTEMKAKFVFFQTILKNIVVNISKIKRVLISHKQKDRVSFKTKYLAPNKKAFFNQMIITKSRLFLKIRLIIH